MPDLNYRNAEVTTQMENVVNFWLDEVGVDGFRIDAAKHLIEEDGKIENTESTHDWYKGFYEYYKTINPDATPGEEFEQAFIAKTYENHSTISSISNSPADLSSASTGTKRR
jgi:glycosidase